MDDVRATFNITCCVLGIGSLSMARASASASPPIALAGLILMTVVSIYATLALSKCMLASPRNVVTYSDLGEHLFGHTGRMAVLLSQIANCLMVPIAFLVLGGGQLLPQIFASWNLDANFWIPIMALSLLPVVLIRSLKEGAWVALIGAAGAFFGDLIALVDALKYTPERPMTVNLDTHLKFANVVKVFGSFSLAFGAAVVIPSIQRDHANPASMTKPIVLSLSVVAVCYAGIGGLGYFVYGCEAPANLLSAMNNKELEALANVMFLIHIMIGFAVLLHPALFLFERKILGFHGVPQALVHSNVEAQLRQDNAKEASAGAGAGLSHITGSTSVVLLNIKTPNVIREENEEDDEDAFEEMCSEEPLGKQRSYSPVMSINRRRPHSAGVVGSLLLDTPGKRMSRCGSDFELYQPYGLASTPLPWVTTTTTDEATTSVIPPNMNSNHHDVWTIKERLQSYGLRTTVVLIQTFIAMCLQSVFDDLADFCGATCIVIGCVILPVLFYYRMFRDKLGRVERAWCWFIIGMSAVLGVYTSILCLDTMGETLKTATFFEKAKPKAETTPRQFCF